MKAWQEFKTFVLQTSSKYIISCIIVLNLYTIHNQSDQNHPPLPTLVRVWQVVWGINKRSSSHNLNICIYNLNIQLYPIQSQCFMRGVTLQYWRLHRKQAWINFSIFFWRVSIDFLKQGKPLPDWLEVKVVWRRPPIDTCQTPTSVKRRGRPRSNWLTLNYNDC